VISRQLHLVPLLLSRPFICLCIAFASFSYLSLPFPCFCSLEWWVLGCFSWSFSFKWLRLWFSWSCVDPVSNLVAVLFLDLCFLDHLWTLMFLALLVCRSSSWTTTLVLSHAPRLLENLERASKQLDIDGEAYNLEVKNQEIICKGNMEQKRTLLCRCTNSFSLENNVVLWFDLVVKYEASCWEIEMQFWSDCVPLHKPQLTC